MSKITNDGLTRSCSLQDAL